MDVVTEEDEMRCTGTRYHINPDVPAEGTDVHHDRPCPQHPSPEDEPATPIPSTAMWDAMRRGHLTRTGHVLRGFFAEAGDGTYSLVRECCQDTPHPGADR